MKVDSCTAFRARVKINNIPTRVAEKSGESLISSYVGSMASTAIGSLSAEKSSPHASNAIASVTNSAGVLLSMHALGTTTSNVVPFALETAGSVATPATVVSLNNHPSVFATLFSTIGSFFEKLGSKTSQIKDPS